MQEADITMQVLDNKMQKTDNTMR